MKEIELLNINIENENELKVVSELISNDPKKYFFVRNLNDIKSYVNKLSLCAKDIKIDSLFIDYLKSNNSEIEWIFNVLKNFNFKRSFLRESFELILYSDYDSNYLKYKSLELILDCYYRMDGIILNRSENKLKFDQLKSFDIKEYSYLESYIDTNNISDDNVYVLCNYVWEELVHNFNEKDDIIAIQSLVAKMIELTGKFISKRLKENKKLYSLVKKS